METPAIDHLSSVNHKTQIIHDFLEWLGYEKEVYLCKSVAEIEEMWTLTQYETDNLMAECYGVDLKAVEAEKRAILEEIRRKHDDAIS